MSHGGEAGAWGRARGLIGRSEAAWLGAGALLATAGLAAAVGPTVAAGLAALAGGAWVLLRWSGRRKGPAGGEAALRRALLEREELLHSVVAAAPLVLFAVDRGGRVTFAEGHELRRLGEPRELVGRPVREAFRMVPEVLGDLQKALEGRAMASTLRMRGVVYECRYMPLRSPHGEVVGAVGVALDVSERHHAQERLNYLAYYDELTRLPNRLLFKERLRQALAEAERYGHGLALFFLDLDDFKKINDTLGHEAGDQLLRDVAQRLRQCVRKADSVARLAGDEFTLIISPVHDPADVTRVAGKILDRFAEPFVITQREFFISPSIGITLYPEDGTAIERLLKNADTAMYHAKAKGRNNYQFYSQDLSLEAHRRLELERRLRHALDRGELVLHYQPVAAVEDEELVGLEALLRWEMPGHGILMPRSFLPLAEETGFIVQLGQWVLDRACTQLAAWRRQGLRSEVRLGINLSLRELRERGLSERMLATLERHGIEPESLELELPEAISACDDEAIQRSLRSLADVGFRFYLDDFGTGYSSLTCLRRLPVDGLKIDLSFVQGLGRDPDHEAVVRAAISLGRSLRLRVVAEGVENDTQRRFLLAAGCELIQGRVVSEPLPPAQATAFLGLRQALCRQA